MWQWVDMPISCEFGDSSGVEAAGLLVIRSGYVWFGVLTVLERDPFACGVFHNPFPVLLPLPESPNLAYTSMEAPVTAN